MSKQHKITLSDETDYYLDCLMDKAHITCRNARSVMLQQLIHKEVTKMKVADRPVYDDQNNNAQV